MLESSCNLCFSLQQWFTRTVSTENTYIVVVSSSGSSHPATAPPSQKKGRASSVQNVRTRAGVHHRLPGELFLYCHAGRGGGPGESLCRVVALLLLPTKYHIRRSISVASSLCRERRRGLKKGARGCRSIQYCVANCTALPRYTQRTCNVRYLMLGRTEEKRSFTYSVHVAMTGNNRESQSGSELRQGGRGVTFYISGRNTQGLCRHVFIL